MKKLYHKGGSNPPEHGAALVVTLIVCTVLAMVVVALMQNTGLDRASARSIANQYQATLAAESGLAEALWSISAAIGTNPANARNFIVSETNPSTAQSPVLLIGTNEASVATNMIPLMSGDIRSYLTNRTEASLAAFLAKRTSANSATNVDLNVREAIQPVASITGAAATNWWRAPWVLLTNVVSSQDGLRTNLVRYAFIVVDEQARLNPFFHQGLTGVARTNNGRSASEIRVDSTNVPLVANAAKLVAISNAGRSVITTSDTLALGDLLGEAYRTNKHLVSIHSVIDEDIIPAGYMTNTNSFVAYADAGKPKYDINQLATNPEQVASIISSNLPDFYLRDLGSALEGLSNALYPRRIAAGIADYVDTDTVPTAGLNGEPAGKELTPYVVMVAEKNTWSKEEPPPPASNNISVTIQSRFFLQLWNPYTVPVSGTVGLKVTKRQYVELQGGGPKTDFSDYSPADQLVSLQPNEMKAVGFDVAEQVLVHPTARPSATNSTYPTWTNTSSGSADLTGHPQFRATWNGTLLDMNRQLPEMASPSKSGLVRQTPGNNFGPVSAVRWAFNFCPPNTNNTVGDPRANFVTESDWAALANITNAMWQGSQTDVSGRSQNFTGLWRLRDYVRANPRQGTPLASSNADPLAIPSTYNPSTDGPNAPVFLRNGPLLSVGELGNIFDPAQVNDHGTNSFATNQRYFRPAGGRSLRIGQPEFPYWDRGGLRAVQILDLFTINPPGTNTAELGSTAYASVPVMRGRININTASKSVLASVFEGLTLTNDGGIGVSSVMAGQMADAVISNRPYSRISDLYKAANAFVNGTNYTPPIANVTATVSNAPAGTSTNYVAMAAMDRAREELFARTVNFFGTQSRAFRIYVVGEALDRATNPVSRAALEVAVQLEAEPAQAGLRQVIKWKKSL